MSSIKRHLSYANVTATLALFIALGGSSYAALQLTGRDIRNNSLTGRDVRNNSLGGRDIKEKRLGQVRRARRADRLGGFVGGARDSYSSFQLLDRCPAGTVPKASVCPEAPGPRPAETFNGASRTCAGNGQGFGRRLPTLSELKSMAGDQRFQIAAEGELSSDVVPTGPDSLDVIVMAPNGSTSTVPNVAEGARPFRCVADPNNVTD
jgi:hypothetical protein